VSYERAVRVAGKTPRRGRLYTCDDALRDLIHVGCCTHDRNANRYDLHPLWRRYAYDRLTAPERAAAMRTCATICRRAQSGQSAQPDDLQP